MLVALTSIMGGRDVGVVHTRVAWGEGILEYAAMFMPVFHVRSIRCAIVASRDSLLSVNGSTFGWRFWACLLGGTFQRMMPLKLGERGLGRTTGRYHASY